MPGNNLITRSLLSATLAVGLGAGGLTTTAMAAPTAPTVASAPVVQPLVAAPQVPQGAINLPTAALPSCMSYTTRTYRPWWNLFRSTVEAKVTNSCRVSQPFRIHKVNSPWTCKVVKSGATRTETVDKSDYRGHVGTCFD